MQFDIAGGNLLVLAWVQNKMRILQLEASNMADKFVKNVIAVDLYDMGQQKLPPLFSYNDSLNSGLCVQPLMVPLNNVYILKLGLSLHKFELGKLQYIK